MADLLTNGLAATPVQTYPVQPQYASADHAAAQTTEDRSKRQEQLENLVAVSEDGDTLQVSEEAREDSSVSVTELEAPAERRPAREENFNTFPPISGAQGEPALLSGQPGGTAAPTAAERPDMGAAAARTESDITADSSGLRDARGGDIAGSGAENDGRTAAKTGRATSDDGGRTVRDTGNRSTAENDLPVGNDNLKSADGGRRAEVDEERRAQEAERRTKNAESRAEAEEERRTQDAERRMEADEERRTQDTERREKNEERRAEADEERRTQDAERKADTDAERKADELRRMQTAGQKDAAGGVGRTQAEGGQQPTGTEAGTYSTGSPVSSDDEAENAAKKNALSRTADKQELEREKVTEENMDKARMKNREKKELRSEAEEKQQKSTTSFAGISNQQLEQMYRNGEISRYDYESEIAARKEALEESRESSEDNSKRFVAFESAQGRVERLGDAIDKAFSSKGEDAAAAKIRMDAIENIELGNEKNMNARKEEAQSFSVSM